MSILAVRLAVSGRIGRLGYAAAHMAVRTAGRLLVPLVLAIAWQMFGAAGLLPRYLSYPTEIAAATAELAADGELWVHAAHSIFRLILGFAIGTTVGTVLGLLAHAWRPLRDFIEPIVAFVYPVPKIAFLSVILLLFGLGHTSKIAIIAFSVFFPMFIATLYAVAHVDRHFLWVARNFEAAQATIFFRVMLPGALPGIFSGLRVALALSFIVLFAAELIGAKTGLSRLVVEGEEWGRFDVMLAGILGYAFLGFLADRLLMRVRRYVLRGQLIGTQDPTF